MTNSKSAKVRASLAHPVVDSDGHTIEFEPAVLDYLRELAGREMVEQYRRTSGDGAMQWRLTDRERRERRVVRSPWWVIPAENTLDRATASLPRLLVSRLEELGMDFSVVYASLGLVSIGFEDEALRRATCRAFNAYHADLFREHARWLTPAAIIPMHSPSEALAELDYAVAERGLKVVMMAGAIRRPLPAAERISPEAGRLAFWVDTLGLDSAHDYDPVWARCVELGVCPTFHTGSQGWGARRSVTNFVYNHTGHFAAAGEATCKSLFLGGVTRRFPQLRFAFLERDTLVRLFREYAEKPQLARLAELIEGAGVRGDQLDDEYSLDEFAACGIARPEDVRNMNEVVEEAWELVEHGLFSKDDFRAFTFENPVRFWTALNPGFFDGTSVESAAGAIAPDPARG